MTLAQFRDWLKTQVVCPNWYIGKIDSKKEQCIGLYNISGVPPVMAVGGIVNTSYAIKAVSLLIHWGRYADIAEQKAQTVYDLLLSASGVIIDGKRIIQFRMIDGQPISAGTDSKGRYEYVIEVHIYHER